jgi:hypothetical protein
MKDNQFTGPIDAKCVICLTVRNTKKYVKTNFKNFKDLQNIFNNVIVSYYVESNDMNTIDKIQKESNNFTGEVNIIINKDPPLKYRTERIAKGRNANLDFIRNYHRDAEFFIVMDGDNVTSNSKFNYNVLRKYLNRDDWDALSFNRNNYYDGWALRYYPFLNDCWNFGNKSKMIVDIILSDITNKLKNLKDDTLLEVYSAFNGFAIYKTDKFINSKYNGRRQDHFTKSEIDQSLNYIKQKYNLPTLTLGDTSWIGKNIDCEHTNFHLDAIKLNNAKIRIAKDKLF